jgi:decaprenylphosphoryl-5-phosphoribose phosphatase
MRPSDSAAPRGTPIPGPLPAPEPQAEAPRAEPAAEPRLALVWSADRDAAPHEQDAVRVLGLTDVLHALRCADRRVVRVLRECGESPRIAAAARVLGLTGEHAAVWLGAGLAGALGDTARRGQWLRATAAVGAAHLAGMGLKRAVRRPRPHLPCAPPLVRTAGGHSFPSAHAASSAAAVVAYGALLPGGLAVPALAAAICVSRLVAGVHYPSDVAAGALLGGTVAWAAGGGHRG